MGSCSWNGGVLQPQEVGLYRLISQRLLPKFVRLTAPPRGSPRLFGRAEQ